MDVDGGLEGETLWSGYLKEEGEGLQVLSSPNCPRAGLESQTEDKRGKHTSMCVLVHCGLTWITTLQT